MRLAWSKEADGVYVSGRLRIERDGRFWLVSYDGQSILSAYRKLFLAQAYAEGWAIAHPEQPTHGLRVIRGGA